MSRYPCSCAATWRHILLSPLSLLFGLVVKVRGWLFDKGILPSRSFPLPVISVGNLAVGGTGKTPHVEYLITLLSPSLRLATLSRGYKRKSKGYVLARESSDARTLGDEPYQLHRKFPAVHVACCASRTEGLRHLLALRNQDNEPLIEAVILDDAFQHRYVRPSLQLLLTDCHRLFSCDTLLPEGRLREPETGKERADIIIVTKCPESLTLNDSEKISKELRLEPHQRLFFTTFVYQDLEPLFIDEKRPLPEHTDGTGILLLTGIAAPQPLREMLNRHTRCLSCLTFSDHHDFTKRDIRNINSTFAALSSQRPTLILTTEKDATRLLCHERELSPQAREHLYQLPIKVRFLFGKEDAFNEIILNHVREHKRNSPLAEE